jgi:hypothetical protein
MSAPTPEQSAILARERAIELAEQDLPVIEQLLDSKGWAYLSRRLRELRQSIRDLIADDENLTDIETRALRRVAKEYGEILRLPQADRAVHHATLAQRDNKESGPSRG